jgi:hypothetical protein
MNSRFTRAIPPCGPAFTNLEKASLVLTFNSDQTNQTMMSEPPPTAGGQSSSPPLNLAAAASQASQVSLTQPQAPSDNALTHPQPYYGYPGDWQAHSHWPANPAAVYDAPHLAHFQPAQYHHSTPPQFAPCYSQPIPPLEPSHLSSIPYGTPSLRTPSAPKTLIAKPRVPSPPSRELPRSWDIALKSFLSRIGFSQALKGFEVDMLVLNPDYETGHVPSALEELRDTLFVCIFFSAYYSLTNAYTATDASRKSA